MDDVFGIDPADDNVDVIVRFLSGKRYTATFFTLGNLHSLIDKYGETGECAGGLYMWSSHMIIVKRITTETVQRTVADLLETGEFIAAFEGPLQD